MRDWLMQKSQPKVEIIELSPMSTAPVTPQVKSLLQKHLKRVPFNRYDISIAESSNVSLLAHDSIFLESVNCCEMPR